jgi:hypothetical protein
MEMATGQATMKGGSRWRTNLRREITDDTTDSALDLVSGELQQCPVTLNSHAPRLSNGVLSYCPRRRARVLPALSSRFLSLLRGAETTVEENTPGTGFYTQIS